MRIWIFIESQKSRMVTSLPTLGDLSSKEPRMLEFQYLILELEKNYLLHRRTKPCIRKTDAWFQTKPSNEPITRGDINNRTAAVYHHPKIKLMWLAVILRFVGQMSHWPLANCDSSNLSSVVFGIHFVTVLTGKWSRMKHICLSHSHGSDSHDLTFPNWLIIF